MYNGRNKTFFLFAFGRHHEKTDEPQSATVPDLTCWRGFQLPTATGGGYPIYDPKSMRQSGATWTADPVPGHAVPTSRFDPVT